MSTNPKDLVGVKKPPLHLVPPALVLHTSQAMANGAAKYGPFNWREHPVKMTVYVGAAMRHLAELLDGENVARDSKVHHAAHVSACMAIILDALETGNLIDDRPTKGCASDVIERMTATDRPAILPPAPKPCQHVFICMGEGFESHSHQCGLSLGHNGDHAGDGYRWDEEVFSKEAAADYVATANLLASLHDDIP